MKIRGGGVCFAVGDRHQPEGAMAEAGDGRRHKLDRQDREDVMAGAFRPGVL